MFKSDVSGIRASGVHVPFCNSSGAKEVFLGGGFLSFTSQMLVLYSTSTMLSSLQVSTSVEDFKVNLSGLAFGLAVMSLMKGQRNFRSCV